MQMKFLGCVLMRTAGCAVRHVKLRSLCCTKSSACRAVPYLHALLDDVNRREDYARNCLCVAANKHISKDAIVSWHQPFATFIATKVQGCCRHNPRQYRTKATVKAKKPLRFCHLYRCGT